MEMFQNLSRLFASPARIKLLKFFILQPDIRVGAHEVRHTVGASEREMNSGLRTLVKIGVLSSRTQNSGTVFFLNKAHELVPPLTIFLEKTTKPSERTLADLMRLTRGVVGVIATGNLVNEARSSLDLLIIVKSKGRYDTDVAKAVKRLERLVAIPLRYAILDLKEYKGRLEARDRLLRDVFEFKHAVLVGKHRFVGVEV